MPKVLTDYLHKLFDLRKGAERNAIIVENIKNDIEFRGARLWTLIFAIGVASVGLNINSIPVVIGAMLISPLMGPIVGAGLALATNDSELLRKSSRSLLVATIISIIISAIYFAVTPITNAQSELLSRTQPTIFDVFIALFGGLAGFIGASRAEKSNVIPGVAIATALIPPLCTIGYGVATLQPTFIFGALYLFVINCIFICIATFVISKYMRLPRAEYLDEIHKKKVTRIITATIVVIIIPAVYLAYTFVQENNFNQNAKRFIQTTFEDRGYVVIHRDLDYESSPRVIELAFLSERFTEEQMQEFEARLVDFDLMNTHLDIRQDGFTLTEEEWQELLNSMQGDAERVRAIETKFANEQIAFSSAPRILSEAQAIDKRIVNIAIGTLSFGVTPERSTEAISQIVLVYIDEITGRISSEDAQVIEGWLDARLENSQLITYFLSE